MEGALDPETMSEMAQLAAAMSRMYPPEDMANRYPFMGEDTLTYDEAMELMGQLQGMDELESRIQEATRRANLEDLDLDEVQELLGDDARRDLEQLQRIARMLEEAGYVTRKGNRLELTPKGIRRIGQKAMKDIFSRIKRDRAGQHQLHMRGTGGERYGDTKPYEFGDPFDLHLERTLRNALLRNGGGTPVRMAPADFGGARAGALGTGVNRPPARPEPLDGHARELPRRRRRWPWLYHP